MKIVLGGVWAEGKNLRAEVKDLMTKGWKLVDEGLEAGGYKLESGGYELLDEGWKLRAEGDKIYQEAVDDFFGEGAEINWWSGEIISNKREPIPFSELIG